MYLSLLWWTKELWALLCKYPLPPCKWELQEITTSPENLGQMGRMECVNPHFQKQAEWPGWVTLAFGGEGARAWLEDNVTTWELKPESTCSLTSVLSSPSPPFQSLSSACRFFSSVGFCRRLHPGQTSSTRLASQDALVSPAGPSPVNMVLVPGETR